MSEALSHKAAAFLRSVDNDDEPTIADYDRVRAGVKAQLAASVAAGVAALVTAKAAAATEVAVATTTAAATGVSAAGVAATGAAATTGGLATISAAPTAIAVGGAGTALMTKIVAVVLVAGAVAGGATAIVRRERPESAERPGTSAAVPSAHSPATAEPARPIPAPRINLAPAPEPRTASSPSSAQAPQEPRQSAALAATQLAVQPLPAPASPAAPSVTTMAAPSSLDSEIALLRDAHAALRGGDAPHALALLDAHDHLYPMGALSEDTAAERIYALCALGRVAEARELAERFIAAHPASPHASAVRASCGSF
jgi:hypothetical protein